MEFKIQAEYLKEIFKIASACSNEIRFEFYKSFIKFSVTDTANILLLNMVIPASICDVYNIGDEEKIIACINVSDIVNISKLLLCSVFVIIRNDKIYIDNGKYVFSFDLLKDSVVKKSPKGEYNIDGLFATSLIPVVDFKRFLSVYKKYSDKITLRTRNDGFHAGFNKATIMQYNEYNGLLNTEDHEISKSHFSVEYLCDIFSVLSGIVNITTGIDKPCEIRFKCCDGIGNGYFMLAPRIIGDDE